MNYFKLKDFNCTHTGKNEMQPEFLEKLIQLREVCGFPFVITSGYRDATHPSEATKVKPGTHNQGIACDIRANGVQAFIIMKHAFALGFTGIARGSTFVHVDTRTTTPVVWTY